ncbi:hypothetical protein [Polyangium aurulentum]|uniref:hypothetical protein n=1 Tax=Polyangium aurulentum TaxID=2567896 RepID=UPI0010AECC93|nr:hypothetical protein [Polyangium aurulentum]UQA59588.1 hypothetical protein E8A73_003500 [Polyangium aurulentum]
MTDAPKPGNLAALVDGKPLPEEEARDLWKRFSEHMGDNKGDMEGFAKKNGYTAISPEFRGGRAVLVAYTTTPPPAPAPARGKPGGGGRGAPARSRRKAKH